MDEHLIFYDGTCGLCHGAVKYLLQYDHKKQFLFAPLQGKTAKKYALPQVDSMILIENFKTDKATTFIKGKAFFQIVAIIYPSFAFLKHLPAFLVNPPYDLVAYVRYKLFQRPDCLIPKNLDSSRFLE